MKYIAAFSSRNNKYYARSISSGKTVTTARLMEEVASASTVAFGANVKAKKRYIAV